MMLTKIVYLMEWLVIKYTEKMVRLYDF